MKHGPGPRYDYFDRQVLRMSPNLEKYVKQQGWWWAASVGVLGVIVLPTSYRADLGLVGTVLGVIGCCLMATVGIVMLRRGTANETAAQLGPRDPPPTLDEEKRASPTSNGRPRVSEQGAEPGLGSVIAGAVLLIGPNAVLLLNASGWWWFLYGAGWFVCWVLGMACVAQWAASHRDLVGPVFWGLLGVGLAFIPLSGLKLEVNDWWWALFGAGWFLTWITSIGMVLSSIDEGPEIG